MNAARAQNGGLRQRRRRRRRVAVNSASARRGGKRSAGLGGASCKPRAAWAPVWAAAAATATATVTVTARTARRRSGRTRTRQRTSLPVSEPDASPCHQHTVTRTRGPLHGTLWEHLDDDPRGRERGSRLMGDKLAPKNAKTTGAACSAPPVTSSYIQLRPSRIGVTGVRGVQKFVT